MILQCTDGFISRHHSTESGWVITGDRAALATYTAWNYGLRFASRFLRDGARRLDNGRWVLPVSPGSGAGRFRRKADATRALISLAGIIGHEDGRLGRLQRDHGLAVERLGD